MMQWHNVLQVVQDTVTDAVQEAVAAAFEENGRFDVRANFYTLIAITGVVLYWRGIWNSWSASLLPCLVLLQYLSQVMFLMVLHMCNDHLRST